MVAGTVGAVWLACLCLYVGVEAAGVPAFSHRMHQRRRMRETFKDDVDFFPLLEMEEDAHMMLGVDVDATICTCKASTSLSSDGVGSLHITAQCQTYVGAPAQIHMAEGCNCFGHVVDCTTDTSGKLVFSDTVYQKGICDGIPLGRPDPIEIACEGAPCELQGSQTSIRTQKAVGVNLESCQSTTRKSVCTTNAACDCAFTGGAFSACSATCGLGVKTRPITITRQASNGGTACPADSTESAVCDSMTECPIDCKLSEFSEWSACSQSCGDSAIQTRRKTIIVPPQHGGKNCSSPLLEDRPCTGLPACSSNCTLSPFGDWSSCSTSCGGGRRTRERKVIKEAVGAGSCEPLVQTESCNVDGCPVDCELAEWSNYSKCSKSCGNGTQMRQRNVVTPDAFGGKPCGALVEARPCAEEACPIDCQLSEWSNWTECFGQCGEGRQTRSRSVLVEPNAAGAACEKQGVLVEARDCDMSPCQKRPPCIWSNWTEWSLCSKSCGGGVQRRSRALLEPVTSGCGDLEESQACNTHICSRNATCGPWGEWSACSATCGTGQRTRTRHEIEPAIGEGSTCVLSESAICDTAPCPQACALSVWSNWSACSANCSGLQERVRQIVTEPRNNGAPCAALLETRECNTHCVPCDAKWGPWGDCSKTCGGGLEMRNRTVPPEASPSCTPSQSRECNQQSCPVDCQVSEFGEFSACTASCGGGFMVQTRTIVVNSSFGGAACPSLSRQVDCNTQACPVDCVMGEWSTFSECSLSCGGGTMTRSRDVQTKASFGGAECGPSTEEVQCHTEPCPLDCQVGPFGNWSQCSQSCGMGTRVRSRPITRPAAYGGEACPALNQTVECGLPCPVNCAVTAWGTWSQCTVQCGGGTQTRERHVLEPSSGGGVPCPNLIEVRECGLQACPNCTAGPWSNWSTCSKSCGSGVRTRTRDVTRNNLDSAVECPPASEKLPCNTIDCAVDCVLSEWNPWSACSAPCAGGVKHRNRTVTSPAVAGGKACGSLYDMAFCNEQPCPSACEVTDWSPWTTCSQTCMAKDSKTAGQKTRTRSISKPAVGSGADCPVLKETVDCGLEPCPEDCTVSAWSEWSACSVSCGSGGIRQRTRTVLTPAVGAGKPCPALIQESSDCAPPCVIVPAPRVTCQLSAWSNWTQCPPCGDAVSSRSRSVLDGECTAEDGELSQIRTCASLPCPLDCLYSPWSLWTSCTQSCGGGHEDRFREVVRPALYGGKQCDSSSLHEVRPCKHHSPDCPVDCRMSQWSEWSECSTQCGTGTKTRSREVIVAAAHNGSACPLEVKQSSSCNVHTKCPVDCQVSAWGAWSNCSSVCNGGVRVRRRTVLKAPMNGGKACPALTQTWDCNAHRCPVNCETTHWDTWSPCSAPTANTCEGLSVRTRAITAASVNGGAKCGALKQHKRCAVEKCAAATESTATQIVPVVTTNGQAHTQTQAHAQCTYSAWSGFTPCMSLCPGLANSSKCSSCGLKQRTRQAHTDHPSCTATHEQHKCTLVVPNNVIIPQMDSFIDITFTEPKQSGNGQKCLTPVSTSIQAKPQETMSGGATAATPDSAPSVTSGVSTAVKHLPEAALPGQVQRTHVTDKRVDEIARSVLKDASQPQKDLHLKRTAPAPAAEKTDLASSESGELNDVVSSDDAAAEAARAAADLAQGEAEEREMESELADGEAEPLEQTRLTRAGRNALQQRAAIGSEDE